MNIVFAGTPDFAAVHLRALLQQKQHSILAVLTQPDRPAGRGKKQRASPVKIVATNSAIPVLQPLTLKEEEAQSALAALKPDLMVVVAYGLLLPQVVLDIPAHGCINVHASILPRWRGAAPVQRAIEAGDLETGVSIMQMDAGLDTGPVWRVARCSVNERETSASLFAKLDALGPRALLHTLDAIESGSGVPHPQQNAGITYAKKIGKDEAMLDWSSDATALDRKIRAFDPEPGTWTLLQGNRVKIWSAHPAEGASPATPPGQVLLSNDEGLTVACAQGALLVTEMQLPGKQRMAVREILKSRSNLFAAGQRFG